ncbi:uncharacterized protein LOC115242780 isoform X1 [Formica exsecta]|uniref:uncharacterized protein LOC115242780 isoform X1 n=1 Tax=Formica exsecta TaxID=72781 RepID=UPI00114458E3|nr:uncharacterized protein LOC115242780 isoform X1 [Formica exsecta]
MDKSFKMQKTKEKNKSRSSSSADYVDMLTDGDVGKDFGTLINAPLSKNGHFVFKSEKAWSVDSSQYSEFFILNLKTLSIAIDCIPFNEYINVNDRYFTSDQLTNINNDAEKGKATYNTIFYPNVSSSSNIVYSKNEMNENTKIDQSKNLELTTNTKSPSEDGIDNLEDIDFLLSLKEPVQSNPTISPAQLIFISHNDSKAKPKSTQIKPIDLEKWLDTVLDD